MMVCGWLVIFNGAELKECNCFEGLKCYNFVVCRRCRCRCLFMLCEIEK